MIEFHVGGKGCYQHPPPDHFFGIIRSSKRVTAHPWWCVYLHGVLLGEFALSPQVGEKFTPWDVFHEEEKESRVLCEPL